MYGSDVILEMILILGLHWTARLRTLELDIAVGHSQVNVQVLSTSDKLTTYVTWDLQGIVYVRNILHPNPPVLMITHHRSLVSVLQMSPESEGCIEDLCTVTADGAGDAQLQFLAVHLMDFLQVSQHLLTHGVFEHQETPSLGTLVVFPLWLLRVELQLVGDKLGLRLELQLAV